MSGQFAADAGGAQGTGARTTDRNFLLYERGLIE